MISNGWTINVDKDNVNDPYKTCDSDRFHGWMTDDENGDISATFKGFGTMTVTFSNCYKRGSVLLILNNEERGRAREQNVNQTIMFSYQPNDVLKIKEIDRAMIQLRSIIVKGNDKRNHLHSLISHKIIHRRFIQNQKIINFFSLF